MGRQIDPEQTKARLGAELKKQLQSTQLDKVTVSNLTAAAGVTRQTFYYHFGDVYDLAVWVFTAEVADHIMAHATYSQWADGLTRLLEYLQANREPAFATIRSLTHEELEGFFYRQFRAMMQAIVAEMETQLPTDLSLRAVDRDFVIDHYALGIVGHVLHWFSTGMTADPRVLVEDLELILRGNVLVSLERFAVKKH